MIYEMDYEKIRVKDLCQRAKINKKTFYRYYSFLDYLLSELQGIIIEEYLMRIKEYKIPDDLDKINREFFLYSLEKGPVYEKITCNISYTYVRSKMINNVMNNTWKKSEWFQNLEPLYQNILLNFIKTSALEIYSQWIKDGKKVPIEEIIKISNQLLCSGVNGFIKYNT